MSLSFGSPVQVAWVTHDLTLIGGAPRILLKRVDLVNCDAAFGNIQLFP